MKLSMIVTSDLHGEYGRFQALGREIRKRQPDLLIDNGDFLQGSPLSYYYEHICNEPHPMITLANELRYDAAVWGNHDFQHSMREVQLMRERCLFPWISCNLPEFAEPYIVKRVRGCKVVILGATTHHLALWDEDRVLAGIEVENALEAIERWVDYIRQHEQPDLLIAAYHGGFAHDPHGEWVFDANTGENQALELLKMEGIDLLVTGHQHLWLQGVGASGSESGRGMPMPYVQPGSHGLCFAELHAEYRDGRWRIESKLIAVEHEEPLPLEPKRWLETPIAYLDQSLAYDGLLDVMLNGHPYVDFIHQFLKEESGAQLAVTELFYREKGGFSGTVTRADVIDSYPKQHKIVLLRMSGAQILQALEASAAVLAFTADGSVDYSVNVFPGTLQPYEYDLWSDLTYQLQLERPPGERIADCMLHDKPLVLTEEYTVAVNSFRALGLSAFSVYREAEVVSKLEGDIPGRLMRYLELGVSL